jgi:hypothetical protein
LIVPTESSLQILLAYSRNRPLQNKNGHGRQDYDGNYRLVCKQAEAIKAIKNQQ